jgi:hypothetical protein
MIWPFMGVIHLVSFICNMIRGLKVFVICNYDMGVIHLVSFICNMIRGLKVFVICNYDMGVIHLVSFICNMIRGLKGSLFVIMIWGLYTWCPLFVT